MKKGEILDIFWIKEHGRALSLTSKKVLSHCSYYHTKKNKSENLGGISWVLGFFLTNVVVIN